MAQTTFTIRMDSDTKKDFCELCSNIGLTMSTAISIFAKKAVSEQRIPFEVSANREKSKTNTKCLEKIIKGIENGTRKLEEHDLIEVSVEASEEN